MIGLTQAQWIVLQFVRSFISDFGVPPSLQDIAEHTGRWPSAVNDSLDGLEAKGFIERRPGIARGIVLRRKGQRAKEPLSA